jgi:hypothetical protein
MRTMRKVKKGQRYVEYGRKDRGGFTIESVSPKSGFATTVMGTKIRISRLASTRWYGLVKGLTD